MPAERWMAATGAAVVALAILGMFHLAVGGGSEAIGTGEGGGAIGFGVSAVLVGALGEAGAWIVLGLLVIVGLLLYFNMTIGDLVASYLADRDEAQSRTTTARNERRGRERDAATAAAGSGGTRARGPGEGQAGRLGPRRRGGTGHPASRSRHAGGNRPGATSGDAAATGGGADHARGGRRREPARRGRGGAPRRGGGDGAERRGSRGRGARRGSFLPSTSSPTRPRPAPPRWT